MFPLSVPLCHQSIRSHSTFTSTFILLCLQHHSNFPSNITPHSTPNWSAPFYFNYSPLSHHISSIPLYSTHTNTHSNTIVILIAPRHVHFSYCSSSIQFSHTTHYPLCSYLTLNLTACNNTIWIVTNTNISHTLLIIPTAISISPTFLSATPLSYIWPIHYYLNRSHFYDSITLRPYLIFVQLLSVFTRKWCKSYRFSHHTYSTHI